MKKIILHLITSLNMGGAETLLCDLLERADTSSYEYAVIYFHEGPNVARLHKLGIPTYHIKGLFCLYDPIFFFPVVCVCLESETSTVTYMAVVIKHCRQSSRLVF